MKILVIQLTRLGDIVCTAPALVALRREYPEAQIHFLVRKKFAEAAEVLTSFDHLWRFDTQEMLKPYIVDGVSPKDGCPALNSLVQSLRNEKYDKIINLTFSPMSSFLTHLVSQNVVPVMGYTRTPDFFLHVPDQASRYFRAHVGVGKNNRLHMTDVLAWVSGVFLKDCDWHNPTAISSESTLNTPSLAERPIVCHIGASQGWKSWSADSWAALVGRIIDQLKIPVTLVGSQGEMEISKKITVQVARSHQWLNDQVGKTDLKALRDLIRGSQLFIGADSGPLHIANSIWRRSLNLSIGHVSFWETGPTVPGSRILRSSETNILTSTEVFGALVDLLSNKQNPNGIYCVDRAGVHYDGGQRSEGWACIEWMYFDGPPPRLSISEQKIASQIFELCELALSQLDVLEWDSSKVEVIKVMDRVDELMQLFLKIAGSLTPLVECHFAEKENIPPASREEVFFQTKSSYFNLLRRAQSLMVPQEEGLKGIAL